MKQDYKSVGTSKISVNDIRSGLNTISTLNVIQFSGNTNILCASVKVSDVCADT